MKSRKTGPRVLEASMRSFAPPLGWLQNPAAEALQQVGTRLRPRDVPTVSMYSYQSSRPPPPEREAQQFSKPTCGVRARASSSESVQTESCFRERLICLSDFFFLISFGAQPPKPQTSLPER
ncbi:uncharacterized protein LOC110294761 [Mus caroli]|uniref:Uncharacterized protein LOC110294761 n=1 Tax=Mus caroli TaxID=10089 RepID=A0A6P5PTT4_MUSCR|nr:uncharacterized protein LOC110294761 [Mus caroli]